jgi:hypothetical protein
LGAAILFLSIARYNETAHPRRAACLAIRSVANPEEEYYLADDKLYKAEYLGSGTFVISKPARKKAKRRQTQLKNPQRGSRK